MIGIDERGYRQKLLRHIKRIPRVDIEESIPVSFLLRLKNQFCLTLHIWPNKNL